MSKVHFALAFTAMGIGGAGVAEAQIEHSRTPVNPPAAEAPSTPKLASPTGLYAGVGWATIWADDGLGDTAVLGAIQGRVGYSFTPNFSVEAEAAVGVLPQEYIFGSTSVDLNLDNEIGIFGVFRAPASPTVDIYARAGFARTAISASGGGFTVEGDDSGLAYGIGLEWRSSPNFGARFELSTYTFDEGGDATSLQTSIVGYF